MNMQKHKLDILVFAPYSGIIEHAIPEALTLEAMDEIANIHYVGCNGIYKDLCLTMSAHGKKYNSSQAEKDAICKKCQQAKEAIQQKFNFNYYNLEDFLTEQIPDDFFKNIENIFDFSIEDLPLGKISLYEVILENKKNSLDFDTEEKAYYETSFKNVLITFFASKKMFEQINPDRVVMYNTLYSTNNTVYQYALNRHVNSYVMHAGMNWENRLNTMILAKDTTFQYEDILLDTWTKFQDHPIDKEYARMITKHFEHILNSKSAFNYSVKVNDGFKFYDHFPKAKDKKIFLATLSSLDERLAYNLVGQRNIIEGELFKSQIDWISWLIEYFKLHNDWYLIIRVHPREFPNKRYKNISDNAKLLKSKFINLPNNITINWPDEKISIYNLATETDVLLNSHSSSSLDFLFLGLPVVVYDKDILTFPIDLHYSGCTEESYKLAIQKALQDSWSFQNIYKLYKWMNYKLNLSVFDLSDGLRSFFDEKTLIEKILYKIFYKYYLKYRLRFIRKIKRDENKIQMLLLHSLNTRIDTIEANSNDDDELVRKEFTYFKNKYSNLYSGTKLGNKISG